MAWTLQLLNDDTTLDLNDGTAYSGRPGFLAPPPPVRVAQGGANLFRHGSDIRERVYANRTVTAVVRIHGTSQDNLIANILAVNNLLERAAEYTTTGLGSQVKLRRKWEGATNQVIIQMWPARALTFRTQLITLTLSMAEKIEMKDDTP